MSSGQSSRDSALGTRAWRSLGARLALWYVVVTVGSFIAMAAILPLTVNAWVEREGQSSALGTLDRLKRTLEAGGVDALQAMFNCAPDAQPSVAVRLTDEQNVELYSRYSDNASRHVAEALHQGSAGRLGPTQTAPPGWHVAAATVSQGRQLEIVLHDDAAPRLWSHARETSLVILLCGLASAILGAFVITRRGLRPVGELARITQGIVDSGDLALRVETRGSADGLDQLATLFNRMLARNETLVRAMKESLDNVAHDLRTPLTRLRAGAELALRGPEDLPRAREALAEAIEESDRVLAMLTTLMDITEAETGAMRRDKHVEDLSTITRLPPGVLVVVDRARIRQVCANLIDNAIKYTAPGGRVEVAVSGDAFVGTLSVSDSGIGIPLEEQPRIWDRLYRGDRSRTERGLGLGLSLVKAVVEAHGGEVHLKSAAGAGATFEVRLRCPVPPAQS